jgi:hypothetical protein
VSVVSELPLFLTWEPGTSPLRESCSSHINWMWSRLQTWANARGSWIWDSVVRLPASNQKRLLLAPECFHLLLSTTQPADPELAKLHNFIQLEEHLDDRSRPAPPSSWSALGDYYSGSGSDEHRISTAIDGESGFDEGRPFFASKAGHLFLDAYSSHTSLKPPQDSQLVELTRHTQSELAIAKERIENGLALVRSVSRCAATMVYNSVQVLNLRKLVDDQTCTSSWSWRDLIGTVGLVNTHTPAWYPALLSEALVHEAIHHTIYKLELSDSLFLDRKAASELTAVSPWSERTLKVTSFVHACFVWFGLWNFWRLCPENIEGVAGLKSKAYRGFLVGSPLAGLSPEASACIQPEVRNAITSVYQLVSKPA